MFWRAGKSVLVGFSLAGTGVVLAASSPVTPVAVQCTATGVKYFAPGVSPDQVCQRFVQSFGRASGTAVVARAVPPGRNGLAVDLIFLPQGIASARATRVRTGGLQQMPVYQLAVSDRKFLSSDIDRLAMDVAAGMRRGAARNERN